MKLIRIIVANDDGFYSPGLHALASAAKNFGEALIMAPDREQSAMSHAITIQRPLHHHPIKLGKFEAAYIVEGEILSVHDPQCGDQVWQYRLRLVR